MAQHLRMAGRQRLANPSCEFNLKFPGDAPVVARIRSIVYMKTFETLAELTSLAGQDIAVTDWFTITQQHIDQFAEATGDHQWIHVDPVRAKTGPFGTTIAHGYLTLSLLSGFFDRSISIRDVRMAINYGLNKVRFMAPVPVDSRVRAQVRLLSATPIEGGMQVAWESIIQREGSEKPVCVAEQLARYYL